MRDLKALCIFTTLLGQKPMAQRITQALDRTPGLQAAYVLVEAEDYARYPTPVWVRASDTWVVQYIARQKVRPLLDQSFDLLLVNSWEFVTEFRDLAHLIPAAAAMDGVPATVDTQWRRRGQRGLKRWISHRLQDGPFRAAVRDFRFFMPWSSDCAAALESDYGVKRGQCYVTLAPQDLELWTPGAREHAPPPLRLLFVGNDFLRKGGEFLLRLYAGHLSDFSTLTIASNDASLESRTLPSGVQWLRGRTREELLEEYRSAHVFVFPTQLDYMPQVLAEALATGLPCVANDVGGIRDLVRDGETGYLMSCEDPVERWAERLRVLSSHPEELSRLSAAARKFAEAHLGVERFEQKIGEVIARLTN